MLVQYGQASGGFGQEFVEAAGAGEPADSGVVEPQYPADRRQGFPLGQQLLDRRVTLGRAGHQTPGLAHYVKSAVGWNERHGRSPGRLRRDRGLHDRLRRDQGLGERLPDTSVVGSDQLKHLKRRTISSITIGIPATGASPSLRTYRPCTRHDGIPHRGHLTGKL
ncbi:hypothetical protein OTB20_17145 [Streptomyces sp. H27-H1]|nr:hypothetical protein [Streptomyces sp. H27-H1]MCY0927907.1 hypothetical protein [Streptomyces sp. H27-H1]